MAADPEVKLLIPEQDDCPAPEISIVVPALNEALTIAEFVNWCREGLAAANVSGEIIIVDSSSDRTAEIALSRGARVVKTPKRGLGRAYLDAQPFVRGKFLILGDCDLTYDFRKLAPFVEAYRAGYEYVMGSRFRGTIEEGAMPALHRYFGTPGTTWLLNRMFSGKFSDIHCGMRGITKDAFRRLDLRSQAWEYASEMIIKSVHLGLRTTEVPITFYKDREGRLSHHKRSGWFSPWQAGWINLRAMFVFGADFFLWRPGFWLLAVGLALSLPVLGGPVKLGPLTLSLNWMLLGVTCSVVGLQFIYMSILARVIYKPHLAARWLDRMRYDRTAIGAAVGFLAGLSMVVPLVHSYIEQGFRLDRGLTLANYVAVGGLFLAIISFMTFTVMLVLHALVLTRGASSPANNPA